VEAHHFCSHLNNDVHQCVIYDSDGPDARLIGIEYIISRELFESLPGEEKQYWHSHAHEVQSGTLIAPGLPLVAENEVMREYVSTYGKTIHTWQVDRGDQLPLGPPQLMMSFTPEYDVKHDLVFLRDQKYKIDTKALSENRKKNISTPTIAQGADQWAQSGVGIQFKPEPTKSLSHAA
jgi:hypothetical protein